jgi:hypothetical protein
MIISYAVDFFVETFFQRYTGSFNEWASGGSPHLCNDARLNDFPIEEIIKMLNNFA